MELNNNILQTIKAQTNIQQHRYKNQTLPTQNVTICNKTFGKESLNNPLNAAGIPTYTALNVESFPESSYATNSLKTA